jgi:PKD repeat protein
MNRHLRLYLLFIAVTFIYCNACRPPAANYSVKEEDGPRETLERDIKMMKDPALGYVPTERLVAAKEYKDRQMELINAPIAGVNWKELGPNNQGGRSRAVLVDANDVSGNTIWAGSVGGGLWKTTNINVTAPTWTPVDDLFSNLAISSIAQDPTNAQIMYFSTGEGYGNLDGIRGLGVWKTTNGGTTWTQLSATNNSSFYYCQKVLVNSAGVLFVASYSGLQRSPDGGANFTKVLGTGLGITGAGSNFCYDVDIAANGDVYAALAGSVHKSTNAGVTFAPAQTLPVTASRIEIACAPSDATYAYALVENGNVVNSVLQTTNGGTTWTARTEPNDADPGIPDTDFSRGQAWYDLTIAVDPGNRTRLFVGGIDIFVSADGAATWTQVTHWYGGFGFQYAHADQHNIVFKPGSSSIAYFTNDGGVFQTTNANAAVPAVTDKGTNYRTAQFYACAIHPTALTNYFLAGAQDNGSHQFSQGGIQPTVQVTGGDGAFVHIDQDQPQYQLTSYVYNDFYRSTDGGASFTEFVTSGGDFISPTDYDDAGNRLYMCDATNTYRRWDNPQTATTGTEVFTQVSVPALSGFISAVKVSPNTANRVFFGTQTGRVVRVDNAHTATPAATNISGALPGGYVTCVEVETGNDNHLLVTFSNYGLTSIYETLNGGTLWTAVEGNLPDMPVRWALFNPNNNDQAMIATELGVWTTDNLNGAATVWGASNSGLANVRVDMLQFRQSDKLVIAATHGRGLFSSDAFTSPTALFEADKFVSYTGGAVKFTSSSYKATSWSWNFGDGNTSIQENPTHNYATSGKFNVTLTINGGAATLTKNQYIQILPNRGTPYLIANGGGFEVNPDDFGPDNRRGTPWQRGNSIITGKEGTHGGASAWVTGLTVPTYADNGDASLMSPNYNFTLPGTYGMSFWVKYSVENQFDGFNVQYSLNKGSTWTVLGASGAGWYNFANAAGITAFPTGQPFFTGNQLTYANFTRDLSFLAGNANVAFRIQFKSDASVNAPGVAFDDFEVTGPVNATLPVSLLSFKALNNNSDVLLKWNSENESGLLRYEVQRSTDGLNFAAIGIVTARNGSRNDYVYTDFISQLSPRPAGTLYYRLKMMDQNGDVKFSSIARILLSDKQNSITVGPNPFSNYILVNTAKEVERVILYNASGTKVFRSGAVTGNRVAMPASLGAGVYLLRIETTDGVYNQKIMKQ